MNKLKLRLKNFPISFFAPVLGLAGLSLATLKLTPTLGLPEIVASSLVGVTLGIFSLVALAYVLKGIFFFEAVRAEFAHPIKINFFPIFAKVLLILSIFFLADSPVTAEIFWWCGVTANSILGLSILNQWLTADHFRIEHINPAWFMPVVGNLMVPITGSYLVNHEISWFFFSVGIGWLVILTTVIFYRIIFHTPLVEKMIPTFFILFAAPAIGFISYTHLMGEVDNFGRILFYFAIFIFILAVMQLRQFLRVKFYLSSWAYTFPLAALSLACMLFSHETGVTVFETAAIGIWVALAVIILALIYRTARGVAACEICVEEEK